MDAWLQRLIVRGPIADVRRFAKAATGPGRPSYLTVRTRLRKQRLSFVKLLDALPPARAREIKHEPQEPFDLSIDGPAKYKDGTAGLTFYFQLSAFECEGLLAAVSKGYPRLVFVLGTVAPHVDEQSSLLARAGRVWRWRLPRRQCESIYAKAARAADRADSQGNDEEDETLVLFWEADGRAMDTVVNHWNEKVARLLAKIRDSGGKRKRRVQH